MFFKTISAKSAPFKTTDKTFFLRRYKNPAIFKNYSVEVQKKRFLNSHEKSGTINSLNNF